MKIVIELVTETRSKVKSNLMRGMIVCFLLYDLPQ